MVVVRPEDGSKTAELYCLRINMINEKIYEWRNLILILIHKRHNKMQINMIIECIKT
jgi:hypothetical protein